MANFKYKEVVEAFQFTGDVDNPGWPDGWLGKEGGRVAEEGGIVFVRNKDGVNMGKTGDYVVKKTDGTLYCVFGPAFPDLYEAAPAGAKPKAQPAKAPEVIVTHVALETPVPAVE